MVGYPTHLNSKEDYLYVKDNFPREKWEPDFQALLDSVNDWFFDHVLEDGEIGLTDETHKVVIEEVNVEEDDGNKKVQRNVQYIFKENPTCKLYRIGFTKEEINDILLN